MRLIFYSRIGNFPLKVYESREVKGDSAYGTTGLSKNKAELELILDPDMSPALYWETFWHELGHAFCISYGVEWSHEHVHLLGMGLAQMIGAGRWTAKSAHPLPGALAVRKKRR